jgi:hypothetical protein
VIGNESAEETESLGCHLRVGGAFRRSVHDHDHEYHDGLSVLLGESLQ